MQSGTISIAFSTPSSPFLATETSMSWFINIFLKTCTSVGESSMIRICGAFSMPCYISLPEAAFIGQCCETCLTRRLLPFVALCHVGRLLPAIFDRHVHKYRNGARPAPKLPWGCSGDAPRHLRRGASWLRSRLGGKASS